MSFGMQAHLKRLHFEAAAIVMAELKSRAMDTTPDGARKLPLAEKAARFFLFFFFSFFFRFFFFSFLSFSFIFSFFFLFRSLISHHSRCDPASSVFASKCLGEYHACTAAPCDLGDPGWGDPRFPHGAFVASITRCGPLMCFCSFLFCVLIFGPF